MLCLFLWLRIEWWWLVNRSLNLTALRPVYSFLLSSVSTGTIAWFTTYCTWRPPFIGQLPFVLQLHSFIPAAWHPGKVCSLLLMCGLIVLPDGRGHVRHAGVAYLQRVLVEDMVEPKLLRKMFNDEPASMTLVATFWFKTEV